jgi:LPS sulfotransferase NodH
MSIAFEQCRASQGYLVCTLPRSGSWLLCDMLVDTGVAGHPIEAFHDEFLNARPRRSARDHVRRAVSAGTGANGVFGAKVHWSQFETLARLHQEPDESALALLLAEELPRLRYIWLTRRDKTRQAISYYRAVHTDVWWRDLMDAASHGKPDPCFDFDSIERWEQLLTGQEAKWQAYFEGLDLDPVLIEYEELAQEPEHVLTQILQALRLPFPHNHSPRPLLSRQSDEITEEWRERYLAMKVGRVILGGPAALGFVGADPGRIMNHREIRIAAIQRSGHHGVINWILSQCDGPALFLNDVHPGTNPFVTCSIATRVEPPGDPVSVPKGLLEPFAARACLVHNYEDHPLPLVFSDAAETRHDGWVGQSGERRDVIVLRDPFNTFASRMRASWMRNRIGDENGRAALIALWKQYAQEALGRSALLRHRPLVILFNRWITELGYRQACAHALGLPFSDRGLRRISAEYGGSSFDGLAFDGRSDEMALDQRWRHYADDPLFCEIFADRELLDMSEALFGEIRGTERFRGIVHAHGANASKSGRRC